MKAAPLADESKHNESNRVDFAEREGVASKDDRIMITGGVPLGVTGSTNMLRVARLR